MIHKRSSKIFKINRKCTCLPFILTLLVLGHHSDVGVGIGYGADIDDDGPNGSELWLRLSGTSLQARLYVACEHNQSIVSNISLQIYNLWKGAASESGLSALKSLTIPRPREKILSWIFPDAWHTRNSLHSNSEISLKLCTLFYALFSIKIFLQVFNEAVIRVINTSRARLHQASASTLWRR